MNSFDPEHFALLWGPGVAVLMIFTYGLTRLAHYWIEKSMEFKRKQMDTTFEVARTYLDQFVTSQKSQADAFSRLASSVEQSDSRDSFEHQEILIAVKALREQLSLIPRQISPARAVPDVARSMPKLPDDMVPANSVEGQQPPTSIGSR
jgi:hypothetical protein